MTIETLSELKLAVEKAIAALHPTLGGRHIIDDDRVQLCLWRVNSIGLHYSRVYCSLRTDELLGLPAHAEELVRRTLNRMAGDAVFGKAVQP